MKNVFVVFVMLMSITLSTKAQESVVQDIDPNAAEITFESEVIDYGTVEYDANGIREFRFKNTGKSPLKIANVVGSCTCTVPEWPKEEIAPGKTGVIKAKYDTKRVGSFEKTITITSNAKTPSKVVRIKGVVKPGASPAQK